MVEQIFSVKKNGLYIKGRRYKTVGCMWNDMNISPHVLLFLPSKKGFVPFSPTHVILLSIYKITESSNNMLYLSAKVTLPSTSMQLLMQKTFMNSFTEQIKVCLYMQTRHPAEHYVRSFDNWCLHYGHIKRSAINFTASICWLSDSQRLLVNSCWKLEWCK